MTAAAIRSTVDSSLEVHRRFIAACLPDLLRAADALIAAYKAGRKALFFGNGGSAADAQHLAAEFVGRYLHDRRPLPGIALNVNTSTLTAIGNDYGYQEVFARQLEALAIAGDVVVGLSTSGTSGNVVEAIRRARQLGLFTIALTGASGGALKGLVDVLIAVPSEQTPRIQECHILAGHALCEAVESAMMIESPGSAWDSQPREQAVFAR
jgi:D-sedoheptulose 7-phosphate isomerase